MDVKKNMNAIRARVPDIMIATPGRCYDVMTQAQLFNNVKVLVFDEADSLLDMGFRWAGCFTSACDVLFCLVFKRITLSSLMAKRYFSCTQLGFVKIGSGCGSVVDIPNL